MPTVIDTLIVRLGLDPSAYKSGAAEAEASGAHLADTQEAQAKQAADAVAKAAAQQEKSAQKAATEQARAAKQAAAEQTRAAKAAEADAKKLERQYEKVRNEILSITAASFGAAAIKDFFTSVVGGQSRLLSISKDFGMSARELDAWHKTAREALGGTAEGFDKSVQSILGGIEAFKAGDASNMVVASLQNLGVHVTDASGRLRPMKDVLLDLSAAFQKMPNRQDQLVWAQRLGLDEGTLNMLRQGRGALTDLYEAGYRHSAVTEESAQKADAARREWARLQNTWDSVKDTLFADLAPGITLLNNLLEALNGLMQSHPDTAAGLFGVLMAASTIGGIVKLTGALGGLRTILGGVRGLLGLGGAAGEGAAAAAGGGLAGTLGIAGVLAWLGLKGAKAAGLPDVNAKTGQADILRGDWRAASTHLAAGDFLQALMAKASGKSNADIAKALGSDDLKSAANAQRDASKALTDAAKDLASAMSTNASAAEMPPSSPVAPGKAKDAAAAFMRMGWSKEQAAGLAANLNVESGLRPDIVGDNGAAYGIGQWHADRQAEFRRVFGHDIRGSSLDEQLQFVHYELTRGREQAAGRALRRATTAGEAGAIVSSKYERPLKVQEEMVKRSEAASALYGSLGTALPSVGPAMAAAQQSAAGNSAVNSHNRSEVHVGQITVVSPDTSNGAKVGQDLRHDLSQHGLIAGAAYGMT
ncbi:hypothetical protein WK39_27970 [Burkholderia cepacia]|uniref:phage tail tip lysozyme n=2 Tax=Burkholderia cepacia complex TaxID=87882 RepID=UPI0007534913|nr:phage tail tip lysozyme [Burkholderia cepacia]KVS50701.1 hypothetical protein WK39_27970 [Burkholderia cepacia]KVS65727.1 hypothetical protein WK40_12280 [Burkholderia cepacia]